MRKTELQFPDPRPLCVFPDCREQLPQALSELGLRGNYQIIVLIGGFIQGQHAQVTQRTIEVIAAFAEENGALIICGGSDLGVMASIGPTRAAHRYTFSLLGVNLEDLVTWPNGARAKRFLWWGTERWPLATGYSHFILAPGSQYGEDSPWIAEAATCFSCGNSSVTILANGGSVARKDVSLSLENGRPVIALAGTGRLADEIANQPNHSSLAVIVSAHDEHAPNMLFDGQFQRTRRL